MKCIDKYSKLFLCTLAASCFFTGCASNNNEVTSFEKNEYKKTAYSAEGYAQHLCVGEDDIAMDSVTTDPALKSAGLFSLNDEKILYADNIYQEVYPASLTKVLTAYVALKYGNLDDVVTVHKNATVFPAGAQLCGLREGDKLTLRDLLNGLLLYSGNDNAVAIAEHISGSIEKFADLMNSEAYKLGATHTHFVNPHGLHDDDHHTTAYDMYLIFSACMKQDSFLDIIGQPSYTATITGANGEQRQVTWLPTNLYASNEAEHPQGLELLGGKTGNTNEAKRCLIYLTKDSHEKYYISIVMGAETKPLVYTNMNAMLNAIPNK